MREADHVVADAHQVVEVVHLDQAGHVQLGGQDLQVDQLAGLEALGDQQDRIGAGGAGLVDLPGVDDEILAQDGQLHRVADRLDVLELALEILLVGQDAEGVGAGGFVGLGDRRRGRSPARITPALGVAFFTSAMRFSGWRPGCWAPGDW